VVVERQRNKDETEGIMHVMYIETPVPPNDNGRILCQE